LKRQWIIFVPILTLLPGMFTRLTSITAPSRSVRETEVDVLTLANANGTRRWPNGVTRNTCQEKI